MHNASFIRGESFSNHLQERVKWQRSKTELLSPSGLWTLCCFWLFLVALKFMIVRLQRKLAEMQNVYFLFLSDCQNLWEREMMSFNTVNAKKSSAMHMELSHVFLLADTVANLKYTWVMYSAYLPHTLAWPCTGRKKWAYLCAGFCSPIWPCVLPDDLINSLWGLWETDSLAEMSRWFLPSLKEECFLWKNIEKHSSKCLLVKNILISYSKTHI